MLQYVADVGSADFDVINKRTCPYVRVMCHKYLLLNIRCTHEVCMQTYSWGAVHMGFLSSGGA